MHRAAVALPRAVPRAVNRRLIHYTAIPKAFRNQGLEPADPEHPNRPTTRKTRSERRAEWIGRTNAKQGAGGGMGKSKKGKRGKKQQQDWVDRQPEAAAAVTATTETAGGVRTVRHEVTAEREDAGSRLDSALSRLLSGGLTRSRIQRGVKDGGATINGKTVKKPSSGVQPGDVLGFADAVRANPGFVAAEDIPLLIYHEDAALIVLEKPAGMTVHPAGALRSGTLVNALLRHVGCSGGIDGEPDAAASADGERTEDADAAQAEVRVPEAAPAPAAVAAGEPEFVGAESFEGAREGYHFGTKESGTGYYRDRKLWGNAAGQRISASPGAAEELVQPAAVEGLSSPAMSASEFSGGVVRPGIVHRLDRGTSGVMVVAKLEGAHAKLAGQFAARTTKRVYHAIVWGVPSPAEGKITTQIVRDPQNRLRMAVTDNTKVGKLAVTNWRVLQELDCHPNASGGTTGSASLVEFKLETGRTHQIRVHAKHLGHPLLGDETYGGKQICAGPHTAARVAQYEALWSETLLRPALHAKSLSFDHPDSGERMVFESEMASDMAAVVKLLG